MPCQSNSSPLAEENDLGDSISECRRKPFEAVSWSHPQQSTTQRHKQFHGSLFVNTIVPLFTTSSVSTTQCHDDEVNPDLVGVKAALESVIIYEESVGFSFAPWPTLSPRELRHFSPPGLVNCIAEPSAYKETWDRLLDDLMNGELSLTESDESLSDSVVGSLSSSIDLQRSITSLSSIEITSSDGSVDSFVMPSTPKAKHASTHVEVNDSSPSSSLDGAKGYMSHLSPGRSLNAAASSFVPQTQEESFRVSSFRDSSLSPSSKVQSRSPSFTNFTFPTLNTPSVRIKKDDQGFFTDVQIESSTNSRQDATHLPPFLQESPRNRSRKSRTREIVDRLRSQSNTTSKFLAAPDQEDGLPIKYSSLNPSPICGGSPPKRSRKSISEDGDRCSTSPIEDDDWIEVPQTTIPTPNPKTGRARDLFLAFTRRRTDSQSSEGVLKDLKGGDLDASLADRTSNSTPPSPSPSRLATLTINNDGWIDSHTSTSPEPERPQKKPKPPPSSSRHTHNRKHSRASTSSVLSPAAKYPFAHTSLSASHPLSSQQAHLFPSSPAVMPYFFPAYQTMAVPVSYPSPAFMSYPVLPMRTAPVVANSQPLPYMTQPMGPLQGSAMKASMAQNMNMTYRAKAW